MDILKMLPRRYYVVDGVEYLVTNLTANVNISTSTKLKKSLFLDYQIRDNETARDIADKLYENREYYWTILMVNDMTNSINDWPLSQSDLVDSSEREFSQEELYSIVAYSDPEGNQVDLAGIRFTFGYNDIEPSDSELLVLHTLTPVTLFQVLEMRNDMKRKIKLIDPDLIDDFVSSVKAVLK